MSYIVPPIVMFLNKHPMVAKADLSSLNRLICGAAPLGGEMVDEFRHKNPQCDLGQGLPPFFMHFCLTKIIHFVCGIIVSNVFFLIIEFIE